MIGDCRNLLPAGRLNMLYIFSITKWLFRLYGVVFYYYNENVIKPGLNDTCAYSCYKTDWRLLHWHSNDETKTNSWSLNVIWNAHKNADRASIERLKLKLTLNTWSWGIR